jgi:nucleoside-diphosphate-sugar epimerase
MNVITGGTGSVGMHLVREWLAKGESVRLLVRPDSDRQRIHSFLKATLPEDPAAFERIEWVEGDVTDGLSLEDAFDGARRVVHAAALVSFNRRDAQRMMEVNREGTANVVNAMLAQGVEELVYISSVAALGRKPGEHEVHEEAVFEDGPEVSDYARSKYCAELEVWRGQEEGLRVAVLNPVIVIGPGDYSRSSAALMTQVARGLRFYPKGSNGFVAADDVAAVAWRLVEAGVWGERFVVCGFHASYRELFVAMSDALGMPPPQWPVHRWVAEVAWRMARLAEILTRRPAFVTREALRTSARHRRYRTEKIQQKLNVVFTPLLPTVQRTAEDYLRSRTGR